MSLFKMMVVAFAVYLFANMIFSSTGNEQLIYINWMEGHQSTLFFDDNSWLSVGLSAIFALVVSFLLISFVFVLFGSLMLALCIGFAILVLSGLGGFLPLLIFAGLIYWLVKDKPAQC